MLFIHEKQNTANYDNLINDCIFLILFLDNNQSELALDHTLAETITAAEPRSNKPQSSQFHKYSSSKSGVAQQQFSTNVSQDTMAETILSLEKLQSGCPSFSSTSSPGVATQQFSTNVACNSTLKTVQSSGKPQSSQLLADSSNKTEQLPSPISGTNKTVQQMTFKGSVSLTTDQPCLGANNLPNKRSERASLNENSTVPSYDAIPRSPSPARIAGSDYAIAFCRCCALFCNCSEPQ